jgi:site-specific DNA-methyltransferase (adenine-specific)
MRKAPLTNERREKMKIELFNDNFQNFKKYNIPKAQLVIADIPYNLGANAYASNPMWYVGGDNKNGESKKAGKAFFNSDGNFNIAEYFHFCNRLLKKEPKERGKAPAMIVFCAFEQIPTVVQYGQKYGFRHSYPLVFVKNYSAQVLKANMKIVGATEYALIPIYLPLHLRKDKALVPAEVGDFARAAINKQRREKPPALRVVEWFNRSKVAVIGIEAL